MRKQKRSHGSSIQTPLGIDALYEQELQTLNEEIRRQAARSLFYKLQPQNKTTVEQFLTTLKQHQEIWSEVSQMGIVDFASAILGHKKHDGRNGVTEEKLSGKRTRLNDEQKESLKAVILEILAQTKSGLNRNEIAKHFSLEQVDQLQIDRAELPNKLRQPLAELLHSKRIHSHGAKRLLKYLLGPTASSAKAKRT